MRLYLFGCACMSIATFYEPCLLGYRLNNHHGYKWTDLLARLLCTDSGEAIKRTQTNFHILLMAKYINGKRASSHTNIFVRSSNHSIEVMHVPNSREKEIQRDRERLKTNIRDHRFEYLLRVFLYPASFIMIIYYCSVRALCLYWRVCSMHTITSVQCIPFFPYNNVSLSLLLTEPRQEPVTLNEIMLLADIDCIVSYEMEIGLIGISSRTSKTIQKFIQN